MSITDQFMLAMQAYKEIQAELHPGQTGVEVKDEVLTNNDEVKIQPPDLTGGSLVLGTAEDGLPLVLDLYDPTPGPILIAGDGGTGKTALLQSLAKASNEQNPGEIQFGVVTPFPEEWSQQETLPNCMGIWPAYHPAAKDFLSQMISWADALGRSRQVVLTFVDGLELINNCGLQVQHALRWLMTHGPERHVWPVVTVNPGRLPHLLTWLDYFQTRILGQVSHDQVNHLLSKDPTINLAGVKAGEEYYLTRPDSWLKFNVNHS